MSIAAIVLAGGSSSRMGGQNKLLVDLGSTPILRHVLNQLPYEDLSQAILVTGHDRAAVERLAHSFPLEIVHNPYHLQGMASSILAGLQMASLDRLEAVMICLGDMPYLTKSDYSLLINTFKIKMPSILVPTWKNQWGNPVLFSNSYFEILQASIVGDRGARHLIELAKPQTVLYISMPNNHCLRDIDKPSDI